MRRLRFIWLMLFILAACIIYIAYRVYAPDRFLFTFIQSHADYLRQWVHEHNILARILYVILFVIAVLLCMPITIALTLLAGFLFGTVSAMLYSACAATFGGALMFLLVRYFFSDWIHQHYNKELAWLDDELRTHGAYYLLLLQISPVTPTMLINLSVGLTPIPFITYVLVTFIGLLPGSYIYAFAGKQLQLIHSSQDVMPLQIFFLFLAISAIGLMPGIYRIYRRFL